MATKKYVSLEKLTKYDELLKAKMAADDAVVLASANKYTDDSIKLCDVAGAAASALSDAKAYTDELANGQVKTNKEDIATLKGTGEGSVAKAIADAKTIIDGDVDAVEAIANKNKEDIAAINDGTNGILAQAKGYTDSEVAKVQGEVDNLELYVGTIPEGVEATNIVAYVQEKTSGIASESAMTELGNRVTQAETDIDNIEKDYLKAADRTALEGQISAVQTAVDTEKSRAEGKEGELAASIKVISDDYLKGADKEELQGNINTLTGVVETLRDGVDAEKVDGVIDLINYVEEHGTEVTGMKEDISENAEAIEGVAGRMTTAEGKITAVEGAVATKAEKTYVDEQVQSLQGADTGLSNRIAALEAKHGDGEGTVESLIATAKQEAIDTAAEDATTKAGNAETAAKGHADSLNTAMNTRVEALEAIDHDHSNKAELDLIASGDKAKWDAAAAKAHEHANSAELAKIVDGDVAKWNATEQNAKDYADGLNTAMTTKVDGAISRIGANETAIGTINTELAKKASQTDLDNAVGRIAANETAIASFVECSESDINKLFGITE